MGAVYLPDVWIFCDTYRAKFSSSDGTIIIEEALGGNSYTQPVNGLFVALDCASDTSGNVAFYVLCERWDADSQTSLYPIQIYESINNFTSGTHEFLAPDDLFQPQIASYYDNTGQIQIGILSLDQNTLSLKSFVVLPAGTTSYTFPIDPNKSNPHLFCEGNCFFITWCVSEDWGITGSTYLFIPSINKTILLNNKLYQDMCICATDTHLYVMAIKGYEQICIHALTLDDFSLVYNGSNSGICYTNTDLGNWVFVDFVCCSNNAGAYFCIIAMDYASGDVSLLVYTDNNTKIIDKKITGSWNTLLLSYCQKNSRIYLGAFCDSTDILNVTQLTGTDQEDFEIHLPSAQSAKLIKFMDPCFFCIAAEVLSPGDIVVQGYSNTYNFRRAITTYTFDCSTKQKFIPAEISYEAHNDSATWTILNHIDSPSVTYFHGGEILIGNQFEISLLGTRTDTLEISFGGHLAISPLPCVPSFSYIPSDQVVPCDLGQCTYTNHGEISLDPVLTGNCGFIQSLTCTLSGATSTGTNTLQTLQGAIFNLGETLVVWTAKDAFGNTATKSFNVTVINDQPLSIKCPRNMVVLTDYNKCYATLRDYSSSVITTGTCPITVVQTPSPGAQLNVGTHTITLQADYLNAQYAGTYRDACQFTLTVLDIAPPYFVSPPSNQTAVCDAGECTYTHKGTANWDATANDNCGTLQSLTCILAGATTANNLKTLIGVTFNMGDTLVTWIAKDAHGNTGRHSFTVTVVDDTPPSFTYIPSDHVAKCDKGYCTYTHKGTISLDPIATDTCGTIRSLTCTLSGATSVNNLQTLQGATFNLGETIVAWAATDSFGNTAIKSFKVTVTNDQPISIQCPPNITIQTDLDQCYATLPNYSSLGTTTAVCPTTVIQTPSPGARLNVGTHTITLETHYLNTQYAGAYTDACQFTVTVVDVQKPSFVAPPSNQTVVCDTGKCTYTHIGTANWDAVAHDNCGTIQSPTCTLAGATTANNLQTLIGVTFNMGDTLVTWSAKDIHGNTNTHTFIVSVIEATYPFFAYIPSDQVVMFDTGKCTYAHKGTVSWDAVVQDNCGTIQSLTCNLTGATSATGLTTLRNVTFNAGPTTATWIFKNSLGRTVSRSFTITVAFSCDLPYSPRPVTIKENNIVTKDEGLGPKNAIIFARSESVSYYERFLSKTNTDNIYAVFYTGDLCIEETINAPLKDVIIMSTNGLITISGAINARNIYIIAPLCVININNQLNATGNVLLFSKCLNENATIAAKNVIANSKDFFPNNLPKGTKTITASLQDLNNQQVISGVTYQSSPIEDTLKIIVDGNLTIQNGDTPINRSIEISVTGMLALDQGLISSKNIRIISGGNITSSGVGILSYGGDIELIAQEDIAVTVTVTQDDKGCAGIVSFGEQDGGNISCIACGNIGVTATPYFIVVEGSPTPQLDCAGIVSFGLYGSGKDVRVVARKKVTITTNANQASGIISSGNIAGGSVTCLSSDTMSVTRMPDYVLKECGASGVISWGYGTQSSSVYLASCTDITITDPTAITNDFCAVGVSSWNYGNSSSDTVIVIAKGRIALSLSTTQITGAFCASGISSWRKKLENRTINTITIEDVVVLALDALNVQCPENIQGAQEKKGSVSGIQNVQIRRKTKTSDAQVQDLVSYISEVQNTVIVSSCGTATIKSIAGDQVFLVTKSELTAKGNCVFQILLANDCLSGGCNATLYGAPTGKANSDITLTALAVGVPPFSYAWNATCCGADKTNNISRTIQKNQNTDSITMPYIKGVIWNVTLEVTDANGCKAVIKNTSNNSISIDMSCYALTFISGSYFVGNLKYSQPPANLTPIHCEGAYSPGKDQKAFKGVFSSLLECLDENNLLPTTLTFNQATSAMFNFDIKKEAEKLKSCGGLVAYVIAMCQNFDNFDAIINTETTKFNPGTILQNLFSSPQLSGTNGTNGTSQLNLLRDFFGNILSAGTYGTNSNAIADLFDAQSEFSFFDILCNMATSQDATADSLLDYLEAIDYNDIISELHDAFFFDKNEFIPTQLEIASLYDAITTINISQSVLESLQIDASTFIEAWEQRFTINIVPAVTFPEIETLNQPEEIFFLSKTIDETGPLACYGVDTILIGKTLYTRTQNGWDVLMELEVPSQNISCNALYKDYAVVCSDTDIYLFKCDTGAQIGSVTFKVTALHQSNEIFVVSGFKSDITPSEVRVYDITKIDSQPVILSAPECQSVAVNNAHIFVGVPGKDGNLGCVYVYKRDGSYETIINPPEGATSAFNFGDALSATDSYLMVGTPLDKLNGSVFLFRASGDFGLVSSIDSTSGSDYKMFNLFGSKTVLNNNVMVVGAKGFNLFAGGVYIYKNNGSAWGIAQEIKQTECLKMYGQQIALGENLLLVGSQEKTFIYSMAKINDNFKINETGVKITLENGEIITIPRSYSTNGSVYFEPGVVFDPLSIIKTYVSGDFLILVAKNITYVTDIIWGMCIVSIAEQKVLCLINIPAHDVFFCHDLSKFSVLDTDNFIGYEFQNVLNDTSSLKILSAQDAQKTYKLTGGTN